MQADLRKKNLANNYAAKVKLEGPRGIQVHAATAKALVAEQLGEASSF